jgi:ketosteroid isomerase-like protein
VEIVRRGFEAINRGDWEVPFKNAAPDFVLDSSRALGEWRGVHTGPDQAKRSWEAFTEPWESVRLELRDAIDAGDRVLASTTATLFGRDGIEVTARAHWVWTFRGDKVTRI